MRITAFDQTLPHSERRARGAFYTPEPLVDWIAHELLAQLADLTRLADLPLPQVKILDPAAGDGRFLCACRDELIAHAEARGVASADARRHVLAHCLVGIERDPRAARRARDALGAGADVRVGEALRGGLVGDGEFDLVLGNPPYLQSSQLRHSDPDLYKRLNKSGAATAERQWDLYGAFLERALDWLAPDGAGALVVPSRWQSAAWARGLRALFAERAAVRRIVNFGARQVFADASTYSSVLFFSGRDVRHERVQIDAARKDTAALVPGGTGWDTGHVATRSLGAAPWRLSTGARAYTLARLEAAGPRLGEVASIKKGAGSNADPVFLLAPELAAGLEPDLCVPCVRGRDVGAFQLTDARVAVLPYRDGKLCTPDELARLPRTAAHLAEHRARLEARERGRFRGDTYYCWGRPQNLGWLLDRAAKVVVPDAAAHGRAALDTRGRLVIDTAYAIRTHDARVPLGLVLAVLNSPAVEIWLRATGIPLRGDYFRMKTAYLSSLPLPDPSSTAARRLAETALLPDVDPGEIRRAVLALYGV